MKLYIINNGNNELLNINNGNNELLNVNSPNEIEKIINQKHINCGSILTKLEYVSFLHQSKLYKYVPEYKLIAFDLHKTGTTFHGFPIFITQDSAIDGIVLISAEVMILNSYEDLKFIIGAVDDIKMRENFINTLGNYHIKPITIEIPKGEHKMKIIDNKNNKYTKPEEFKEGDIVLDTDGDYFLITSDYSFTAGNFDLIDIKSNKVVGRGDDISPLLIGNAHLPLIRIDPDDVKLVIER